MENYGDEIMVTQTLFPARIDRIFSDLHLLQ